MDYRKVHSGDPIQISAQQWNELLSLLAASKGSIGKPTRAAQQRQQNSGIVTVRNASGIPLEEFHAVKVVGPSVDPDNNEIEFKRRIVLEVDTPDANSTGLWCVLQEPLAADAFGDAVVSGITIARVNITNAEDTKVEVADGSSVLVSGDEGTGQILWVAGGVGSANSTGEQLALIRLPTGGGGGEAELPLGQFAGQGLFCVATNTPLALTFPFLHEVF